MQLSELFQALYYRPVPASFLSSHAVGLKKIIFPYAHQQDVFFINDKGHITFRHNATQPKLVPKNKAEANKFWEEYKKAANQRWTILWKMHPSTAFRQDSTTASKAEQVKMPLLFPDYLKPLDVAPHYLENSQGKVIDYWILNFQIELPVLRAKSSRTSLADLLENQVPPPNNEELLRLAKQVSNAILEDESLKVHIGMYGAVIYMDYHHSLLYKDAVTSPLYTPAPEQKTATQAVKSQTIASFVLESRNNLAVPVFAGTREAACKEAVGAKANPKMAAIKIDEDSEERYIRKVLHKIRNAKGRRINIAMKSSLYVAYNFSLSHTQVGRIVMQIKDSIYTDIDPSKVIETTVFNPYDLHNPYNKGLLFDNKLYLFFAEDIELRIVQDYLNGQFVEDFIPAFQYFHEETIDTEIKARQATPNFIDQASTSLCGIACICHVIAKNHPQKYAWLVKDLYYYAEAFYGKNKYLIRPRNSLFAQVYDIKPDDSHYPEDMKQADYIALSSIKCSENKYFSFDGQDDINIFGQPVIDGLPSMTTPSEMVTMLHKMLGIDLKNIEDKTKYVNLDEIQYFNDMNTDFGNNYTCFMLINTDFIYGYKEKNLIPEHWIIYQGNQTQNANGDFIFEVFTWGKETRVLTVSEACIKANFFGYIKFWI